MCSFFLFLCFLFSGMGVGLFLLFFSSFVSGAFFHVVIGIMCSPWQILLSFSPFPFSAFSLFVFGPIKFFGVSVFCGIFPISPFASAPYY